MKKLWKKKKAAPIPLNQPTGVIKVKKKRTVPPIPLKQPRGVIKVNNVNAKEFKGLITSFCHFSKSENVKELSFEEDFKLQKGQMKTYTDILSKLSERFSLIELLYLSYIISQAEVRLLLATLRSFKAITCVSVGYYTFDQFMTKAFYLLLAHDSVTTIVLKTSKYNGGVPESCFLNFDALQLMHTKIVDLDVCITFASDEILESLQTCGVSNVKLPDFYSASLSKRLLSREIILASTSIKFVGLMKHDKKRYEKYVRLTKY